MKRIGLIGGMSWESSTLYYRQINELIRERLGGLHSAECVMTSLDFAPIASHMGTGDWDAIGARLASEAIALERAGAGCIVLCTNTMHKLAGRVTGAVSIPFIDLLDAIAAAVLAQGLSRVALLGTRFAMEEPFYAERMAAHGVELAIPDADERRVVDEVIFGELARGIISDSSREAYTRIIDRLVAQDGATGAILGCTEIELLISADDVAVPVFASTAIHARAAVDFALAEPERPATSS
jgi:aspartate racemase